MNWKLLLCVAVANWMSAYSRDLGQLRKLLELVQKRLSEKTRGSLRELDVQEDDLDTAVESEEVESTAPGHTLVRPAADTLESAAKYPRKDVTGSLVYGNLDNLGITYGKTSNRVLYSGFRRNNDVLEDLFGNNQKAYKPRSRLNIYPVIILLKKNPFRDRDLENSADNVKKRLYFEKTENPLPLNDENSDAENDAREMLDIESSDSSEEGGILFRRRGKKHKGRQQYYASSIEMNGTRSSPESSSESSDYEKNPGNPYTIHKNRYKQNWLWNFAMTGDHMNINPKAPQFNSLGPTGAELFYGRKWWYYNQDDYIPFR